MLLEYAVFSTRLGWMGVGRRTGCVARVVLPRSHRDLVLQQLEGSLSRSDASLVEVPAEAFGSLPGRLIRQMDGERTEFDDAVDNSDWTAFRTRVWEATRTIPYGETRSYSWVAGRIGQANAPRAVGQALHSNPVPVIVPCHRVIGANGALVGFGSGCDLKARMLEIERESLEQSSQRE